MRQLKITKSITNRESASLDKYLQEIGREELISAEEEVILAAVVAAKLYDEKDHTFEISEVGNFNKKSNWRTNRTES